MTDGEGGEEESNCTQDILWPYGMAMMTDGGAELSTNEPDVVENDEAGGRRTSVVTKGKVQRGAVSVVTTQRTI